MLWSSLGKLFHDRAPENEKAPSPSRVWSSVMCRKSLSLVKELIETCLLESDGSIQLHAAKVVISGRGVLHFV